MKGNIFIKEVGEIRLIKFIDDLLFEKAKKRLIYDDCFYYALKKEHLFNKKRHLHVIFNTDMLVSSTDAPPQMSFYQIGRKAVLMNISDLLVKGVEPRGIIISLGLIRTLKLFNFRELMEGIIDYCMKFNIDYIGGDLNETKELIINPTVFGFQDISNYIPRSGMKPGDFLVANGKFGLTGVGFDLLLKKKVAVKDYPSYKRSIMSVLEPELSELEGLFLAKDRLASGGIDSSDGLAKSLKDLMISNKTNGFEIDFNENLIDEEAIRYSKEFNTSLSDLVFNGGEEFIHLFTINPKKYQIAKKIVNTRGGNLFLIGKVIPENKIKVLKEGSSIELKDKGYEHFKQEDI